MRPNRRDKNIHVDPGAAISLALSKYHFSGSDIREVIRSALGHAPSKRRISRLSRSDGSKLKRGRPPTITKVNERNPYDLNELTSKGLDTSSGNMLHFLHQIKAQFGLSPRQYLNWVTKYVRRGKYMMRRCLLCGDLFPSLDSADRHCPSCKNRRHQLLRDDAQSIFAGSETRESQA